MSYRIEFTDVAEMEIEAILMWMNARSPERAQLWQDGLEDTIATLTVFPRRYALAPENDQFEDEIRQLIYGSYRVLYTFWDVDGDGEEETVRIVHVRHTACPPLGSSDTEDEIA